MSTSANLPSGSPGDSSSQPARMSKRTRLFQAVNGLLQQYPTAFNTLGLTGSSRSLPGDFPDTQPVTTGLEKLILFPSYCVRRDREKTSPEIDRFSPRGVANAQFWEKDWTELEDGNAIVDVEITGWVFVPHSGAYTSAQRFFLTLVRRMGEVAGSSSVRMPVASSDLDVGTIPSDHGRSDSPFPATNPSTLAASDCPRDENSVFMQRVTSFLAVSQPNVPLTLVFYNDHTGTALSQNASTNEAGHFVVRASLPFIPTHVKVFVLEASFTTLPLKPMEPYGVSVISDIDDTVKHSDILGGARQVIRNTFVNDFLTMAIPRVSEWYNAMKNAGASFHYVSNSPWQLYPVIKQTFSALKLPEGTFHLKRYNRSFQTFMEPVVDRKKSSLRKLAFALPRRKFILIGDSGEADLEAYTDFAITFPTQVLAIFIRNITTQDVTFPSVDGISTAGDTMPSASLGSTPTAFSKQPLSESDEAAFQNDLDRAIQLSLAEKLTHKPYDPLSVLKEKPPALPPRPSTAASSSPSERAPVQLPPRKPLPPKKPTSLRHVASSSASGSSSPNLPPPSGSLSISKPGSREASMTNISSTELSNPARLSTSGVSSVSNNPKRGPPPPCPRRSNVAKVSPNSSSYLPSRGSSTHSKTTFQSPLPTVMDDDFNAYDDSDAAPTQPSLSPASLQPTVRELDWKVKCAQARSRLNENGLSHVMLVLWKTPNDPVQNLSIDLIRKFRDNSDSQTY